MISYLNKQTCYKISKIKILKKENKNICINSSPKHSLACNGDFLNTYLIL
jgi:hypothetical protein